MFCEDILGSSGTSDIIQHVRVGGIVDTIPGHTRFIIIYSFSFLDIGTTQFVGSASFEGLHGPGTIRSVLAQLLSRNMTATMWALMLGKDYNPRALLPCKGAARPPGR
jgi:hypothetical protein